MQVLPQQRFGRPAPKQIVFGSSYLRESCSI